VTVKVFNITQTVEDGVSVIAAEILPDSCTSPLPLWFRLDGMSLPGETVGDAFAVGLLTPAMYEGEPLHIDGPVSATLLGNLKRAQEVLTSWYPFLTEVAVTTLEATTTAQPKGNPLGTACCFSGGVDSWYSLLKRRDEVDRLLLVRGFEERTALAGNPGTGRRHRGAVGQALGDLRDQSPNHRRQAALRLGTPFDG
jgi:hypothetical protein